MSTQSLPLPLRVRSREHIAEGIIALELAHAESGALPAWTPGAHVALETRNAEGAPAVRQYSLCGDPDAPTWRVAILADGAGRGGSLWLHAHAHAGTRLHATALSNHFALEPAHAPVVLVAGGIGITPLMAMADALHRRGQPFRLHYHVRSRSTAAFLSELLAAPYAQHVRLSVDDEGPCAVADIFRATDAPAWVYTCGPSGFMEAVAQAAARQGVAPERIRRERFAADDSPVAPSPDGNQPFTVQLRSTGQVIPVAADQTVVHALAQAGVDVVVSCEQGYCGSCLTRVLEGLPDHRDQFMLPEEQARNDAFTPCCSRALSPCLVLDL